MRFPFDEAALRNPFYRFTFHHITNLLPVVMKEEAS